MGHCVSLLQCRWEWKKDAFHHWPVQESKMCQEHRVSSLHIQAVCKGMDDDHHFCNIPSTGDSLLLAKNGKVLLLLDCCSAHPSDLSKELTNVEEDLPLQDMNSCWLWRQSGGLWMLQWLTLCPHDKPRKLPCEVQSTYYKSNWYNWVFSTPMWVIFLYFWCLFLV